MAKQSTLIANTLAGQTRGVPQAFGGIGGDLETVGRMALNVLGFDVSEDAVLPTSQDIAKKLESLGVSQENISGLIDRAMPSQAGSATAEEKARAFGGGETLGEVIAPGGQIKLAGKVIKATKDLPVGMSIKSVDESLDPLGFYSAASKAVDNIAQEKGTGAQFLAQIEKTPGVKKEELLWTGLDDFLKGKKSVTKAEVQEFLNANRVEVKEVTLSSENSPYRYRTTDEWQGAINDAERLGNFDEAERINQAWETFELGGANKPKFAKYTIPGGENYREILLTTPTNMSEYNKYADSLRTKYGEGGFDNLPLTDIERARLNKFYANEENQVFKSQHFDQPNVLAHMRLNDRVDADGKKVLFVEEVQSDWHQAGRKKGYLTPEVKSQQAEINKQLDTLAKEKSALRAQRDKIQKSDTAFAFNDDWLSLEKQIGDLEKQQVKLKDEALSLGGIPDAPFKTSWHELALKRAIQLASEGGYDRIAFTTGKTQAERYDLSKQIEFVRYRKDDAGNYRMTVRTPEQDVLMQDKVFTPEALEDAFGKELSEKIIKGEGKPNGYGDNLLTGLDLSVGGEGMKGFYDTILPKYLDKYGKKWDARVGMTEIGNPDVKVLKRGNEYQVWSNNQLKGSGKTEDEAKASAGIASVHYMDITPKMKESVLTKGQPLFQMAPAIPAGVAAGQQEDNK